MEPLGGELLIDRFCEARRLAAAQKPTAPPAARAATRTAAAGPEAPRAAAPAVPAAHAATEDPNDTGELRAEVDAFMNRDAIEGADDVEIQEFLKERSGFNPNDLE